MTGVKLSDKELREERGGALYIPKYWVVSYRIAETLDTRVFSLANTRGDK